MSTNQRYNIRTSTPIPQKIFDPQITPEKSYVKFCATLEKPLVSVKVRGVKVAPKGFHGGHLVPAKKSKRMTDIKEVVNNAFLDEPIRESKSPETERDRRNISKRIKQLFSGKQPWVKRTVMWFKSVTRHEENSERSDFIFNESFVWCYPELKNND